VQAGFDLHLTKPVDVGELRDKLAGLRAPGTPLHERRVAARAAPQP
jgi:hypothetical protein